MVYEKELENLLKSLEELELKMREKGYSFHLRVIRFIREVKDFKIRLAFIEARDVML